MKAKNSLKGAHMTEETQAVLDENMPPIDSEEVTEEATTEAEAQPEESATSETSDSGEEHKPNRVQERINKITAEKYAEKRRADELEQRIAELQTQVPQQQAETGDTAPKLEDFDYDEVAYNKAYIQYEVNKQTQANLKQQEERKAVEEQNKVFANYNQKVATFKEKAADFDQKIGNLGVIQLPQDVLNAIMSSDKGPEIAYYLGDHLDVAEQLATSSPALAFMKLGEISAKLGTVKTETKPSTAPEPIEPVNSGGGISKSVDDMSMDEIYNM